MSDEPTLNLQNIQGNVVAGFRKDFQTLLFFRIDDAASFKPAIAELAAGVATADQVLDFNRRYKDDTSLTATWMNLAFSCAGLTRLRDDAGQFADPAFGNGMVQRSHLLGDPEDPEVPGHPDRWKVRDDTAHLMVIVAADRSEHHDSEVERVRALILRHGGATEIWSDEGTEIRADDGRVIEHFGYRDGVSQPGIRGLASAKPGQELVWPGEFVFGYPDQDGRLHSGKADWMTGGDGFPLAPSWALDGSYLVFRRLRQHVHLFHRFVRDNKGGGTADAAGARIVGRRLSGAPILLTPTANNAAFADDNDFEFVAGEVDVCPGNAHIRKVNPRGEFDDQERRKHRLLRRGTTFGPRSVSTPQAPFDDQAERGLLFLAYITSIKYQFEFVMQSWANQKDFRSDEVGVDALLSRDWIEPTGGGYFFAPSKSALTEVLSA